MMNHHTRISKMFGALVLGGGMLIQTTEAEAEPSAQNPNTKPAEHKDTEATGKASNTKDRLAQKKQKKSSSEKPVLPNSDQAKRPPTQDQTQTNPHCQLNFTLHKYDRDGVSNFNTTTCLDDKSDAEILSIIKEAKKQTCNTPFCGCWLG